MRANFSHQKWQLGKFYIFLFSKHTNSTSTSKQKNEISIHGDNPRISFETLLSEQTATRVN